MIDSIRVVLPKKFDLVVGDTFQLFYRGIIDAPDPFCFDILAECEQGRNFPRYFEFLPEEPGQYKLAITVYGPGKKLLGKGETILDVALPKPPCKPLNILCIGDSLTSASGEGFWPEEACRRLTTIGGEPSGLGFEEISFVGTCKKGKAGYEGYGGWQWQCFYTNARSMIWVDCDHDKQTVDHKSFWSDENGNIWVLETIEEKRIKFYRFNQHNAPIPAGGYLTHYKHATNQAPILVRKCCEEQHSPFWDEKSKRIDFGAYCEKNQISGIDAVYILLGGNGLYPPYAAGLSVQQHCRNIVNRGKEMIALIRESFPKVKIRIMGLIGCCVRGGTGTSYGASMPYCDDYGYYHFVMELNRAYEAWTLEPEYCQFMEFINLSGQFDADYNMPCMQKPVNTRSHKMELIGMDGAHPLPEGYLQIADAAFRNMVHLCCMFDREEL